MSATIKKIEMNLYGGKYPEEKESCNYNPWIAYLDSIKTDCSYESEVVEGVEIIKSIAIKIPLQSFEMPVDSKKLKDTFSASVIAWCDFIELNPNKMKDELDR